MSAGWVLSGICYLICTAIYFQPLLGDVAGRLPSDLGDPALNTWILWWNTQALPFTPQWWNAPIFYPTSDMFALSETLLGLTPFSTPLQWLGLSPVATYNVILMLSYPAGALAAHALALRLTGRHDAAFIAGVAFGFSPYRAAHLPHIQLLASWWLPLALLFLHRFVDSGRAWWIGAAAVCWMVAGMTNGYFLVYFAVLIGCWMVWFLRSSRQWTTALMAFTLAALCLLPLLLAYKAKQAQFGFSRTIGEIVEFSADLSAVLAASGRALASRWTLVPSAEGELYPGAIVLVLAVVGVMVIWWSRRADVAPITRARGQRVLMILAALAATAAVTSWWTGGWELGPLSVNRPHRAVTFMVWFTIGALAISPRVTEAFGRRSVVAFYVLATGLMLLMALGPFPRVFGERFLYQAPYAWLMQLPGGDALRVPARFAILFLLCLGQVAALSYARLVPRGRLTWLAPVLGLAMMVDGAMTGAAFPEVAPNVERSLVPNDAVVLELPINHHHGDTKAMLRAMGHGRPLINGYSGYFPPHYSILSEGLTDILQPDVIQALRRLGPLTIIVSRNEGVFEQYRDLMDAYPGATRVADVSAGIVYRLPLLVSENIDDLDDSARPVPVASVAASSRPSDVRFMLDNDITTRWETLGPQAPEQSVTVGLAEPAIVTRVELDLGIWHGDFPRGLRIETAPEPGAPGTVVFSDRTAGKAVLALVGDRTRATLRFDLPTPMASRELRLIITSGHMDRSWSIAELRVFGR